MALPLQKFMHEEEETDTGTPVRYLPLLHVYSATDPYVSASGSSNVMSKKVKARKLVDHFDDHQTDYDVNQKKPSSLRVYTRRHKKPRHSAEKPSLFDSLDNRDESKPKILNNFSENCDSEGTNGKKDGACESNSEFEADKVKRVSKKERKNMTNYELQNLGVDLSFLSGLDCPRLRENRARKSSKDCREPDLNKGSSGSVHTKRWVDIFPKYQMIELQVYWPMDDDWYSGSVAGFDPETKQHHVKYEDGESESLTLSNEKIKFYLSRVEMQSLNLRYSVTNKDNDGLDYGEMLVLAAGFDDCQELEPGDIIWAKLTGHAMWPAVVVNESDIGARKGLKSNLGDKSVSVQFFGTHDFARISLKQVISFLRGLLGSFHLKCKQTRFRKSLEEAKMYLSEQKLPSKMLRLQNGTRGEDSENGEDKGSTCSDDDNKGDEVAERTLECIKSCPIEVGDLRVLSLGKIVRDSEHFHNDRYIWPEGYTAVRNFNSITDPSIITSYKMEVLRDPEAKFRPLFRVTSNNGEQFKGSTPSACWNKIYKGLRKSQDDLSNGLNAEGGVMGIEESGSHMFGFSNAKVKKLIKELACSRRSSIYSGRNLPVGYRPVRVDWKDLDKCSVCHMDEEYENNLFLQCDKCRMMVHARCYGELEPVDGVLWLCNLCRPGEPEFPPPCCLCPVIGGAMKPTTDGRWAHLACAIWIPETCLSDIKRMEPIDGLNRINKDRWKLLCSICGVSYGACIQCSNNTCRVAYHPLCARAAGLCVELEDEDRLHLMSFDEDEDDQCIRLLSFCKKHRQPSNERSPADEQIEPMTRHCSDYSPPLNPSGCARSEPYDFLGRRGRKEPEALAAASVKRLFVENRPYLVSGYCQNGSVGNSFSSDELVPSRFSSNLQKLRISQLEIPNGVLSMAEKYTYMMKTFRKRLAFGKSGIHGFGIFAKHPHRAGDMVIEYTGELVRPSIADRREHFIYNSLVGAGTYMFRIDDERVIDATRAGSIAHLINHSCEPNCYSRVISVHGDEHIIIFAKRDIKKWEELTYDYRFFSIDEQLACYCGFPRCRGVVNDVDAEEQVAKLCVPRSKLIHWTEE
ncbi:PWWP domain [Macleaya cordata]|uniref:PWWP domain n=1 Tax=Macleaya cordata TaxID=56857 RepID=A0A200Q3R8_MACCD|nr:PWWP domain [Macleaya cordata]